jgi:hypothetical protein
LYRLAVKGTIKIKEVTPIVVSPGEWEAIPEHLKWLTK